MIQLPITLASYSTKIQWNLHMFYMMKHDPNNRIKNWEKDFKQRERERGELGLLNRKGQINTISVTRLGIYVIGLIYAYAH